MERSPAEVRFLKDLHRHIFNIKIWFEIHHNDRDLEFFIMKKKVDQAINALYINHQYSLYEVWSCEMIAQDLLEFFDPEFTITKIEVNEDWENWILFE